MTELPETKRIGQQYDQEYFTNHFGGTPYDRDHTQWLEFFGNIAGELIRSLSPKRVLDVGCAKGFFVESLQDRGVHCQGFDISDYAISQIRPDMREYCRVASITDPIRGQYDLISCIEVLEHVSEADARSAVENMTSHTETILFSSTPRDFAEPTHVNVRPIIYWLRLFREFEFGPDLIFDASFVSPQSILFRKQREKTSDEVLSISALSVNQKIDLFFKNSDLQALQREKTAQTAELHRLASALAEKEQSLRELSTALGEKEEVVRTLSATLREKEEVVRALSSELEQKEQSIQALSAQVGQKEEMLRTLSPQLEDKEQSIRALSAEVSRKDEMIHGLSTQADEKEQRVRELQGSVAQKDQATRELGAVLSQIQSSHGWKALQFYYRLRDSVLRVFGGR